MQRVRSLRRRAAPGQRALQAPSEGDRRTPGLRADPGRRHDARGLPVRLPATERDTARQRSDRRTTAEAAAALGRELLADVALYGTVAADGTSLRIVPVMYLADRQRRRPRARRRTEALIERDTFFFGAELLHLLAGNLHLQLDELDAAGAEYTEALTLNGEYARAHIGLGEVAYQRAIGSDDQCALDTLDGAQIERAQDGWDTARRLLDEIDASGETESGSIVADSWILTAQIILEIARSPDASRAAIDPLERALALDPGGERVASAHALLGLTYERLGALDAACEYYGQALDLTEDRSRAAEYAEAGERIACG